MKLDLLAIGELLGDVITEHYVSSLKDATSFRIFQGGSPANVCANLKWMGDNVVLVGCVGDDSIGDLILDSVSRSGLTSQFIGRSKTHPTSIVLVGRSQATPDFIAYRMADTQISAIEPTLIEQSSILHSCAFALSRNPARQHILDAFEYAITIGKTISVDWNFAPAIWGYDGKDIFQKIASMRPLLKMSMDDVCRFWGRDVSIEEAKHLLTSITATVTCLTCGKDGVWYRENVAPDWKFLPAVAVEVVKDTTGAGDAFWSGFLHAYLKKEETSSCIQNGINVAAQKIQKVGPLYLP